ncbi:MAG: HD domain-containing protein [Spirochaetales bacterium]|nr:HD domain-containing protein [Spirochaetales bacterium]
MEARDMYTAGHSDRVANLAKRLSMEMGFDEGFTFYIHIAGHFHDIGKIGSENLSVL